jgi:chemotaxis receptor (MCP) glutamine deamidase CheD/CheY-like chemotaxis protein
VEAKRVFLLPGEFAFSREPVRIGTLLGSCVALCLYDAKHQWGGMNHYMLPSQSAGRLEPGKYGDYAIPMLVKLATQSGSKREDLVASLYGGGQVVGHLASIAEGDSGFDVGQRNISVARECLQELGIRIKRSEVGGKTGRKIHFDTATNEIEVRGVNALGENAARSQRRTGSGKRKIRVLIVDDSATVRSVLRHGIERAPDIEVVAEAAHAYEARERILECDPDVLCLDIIMPRLDGHSFLKRIMQYKPIPTVIVSTIAKRGSAMRQKVIDAGAVDVIDKEELEIYKGPEVIERVLLPKLRKAAGTTVKKHIPSS